MTKTHVVQDTVTEKQKVVSWNANWLNITHIKRLWYTYIAFDFWAEDSSLVDHLANERTWHNWLATSNAVSWMGVVVAQMAKIDRVTNPKHAKMLRGKACLCQILAIVVLLVGTYRFIQEQGAVNGTSSRASQWSLLAAAVLILGLLTGFFVIVIRAELTD